ncbi:hypothetical protein BJY00DRAFT_314076 [Aspergillus carlsbadensis]|nr:hypothetical protein BJY00DRAFT_314076 [Aspergillus carlsbadensis]
MAPRRSTRVRNRGQGQNQAQDQTQKQPQTEPEAEPQDETEEQPQEQTQEQSEEQPQAHPQGKTPAQLRSIAKKQSENARRRAHRAVGKLRATDREPLTDTEIQAFTQALEDGAALLQEVNAQDPNRTITGYQWRYYDGERDEDTDVQGRHLDREYDSDGNEEIPPRTRPELRDKTNSYGPVMLLARQIQEDHIAAVEAAAGTEGGLDRRGLELELDYPTIVKAQRGIEVDNSKVSPCDRCKVKGRTCEKTGWACRYCVRHDVQCTFTHRTTHHTIHLARKPDDEVTEDPKHQGWERKQIRFATKSMVLFHDTMRTTAERARMAEQALAASNKQQVMRVIQQTAATTHTMRNSLSRAQHEGRVKDAEIANLRLQLEALQGQDTAYKNEIRALRIENQHLQGQIFQYERSDPKTAAALAAGKKFRIRGDRRGERERTRQRKAAAAAAAAAPAAPAAQPGAPRTTIDLTGGAPEPGNPFNYDYPDPAPTASAAGLVGTPELMAEDDMNLLQQVAYDFNQPPQPTAQPQGTQQQPNDPYGGLDPDLFRTTASSSGLARMGNEFGDLDNEDFISDDASPEEIARLIEEQDASNGQQGRNADEAQWFVTEASTRAAPGAAQDPSVPSGYMRADGPSWLTDEAGRPFLQPGGEMDETDRQMASMMQSYNRHSPGFDAAVAEAQRDIDADGDEMMMG